MKLQYKQKDVAFKPLAVPATWPFPFPFPKSIPGVVPYTANTFQVAPTKSLEDLKQDPVFVCHAFDPVYSKGGVSIAYRKANDFKNCIMVEVAVVYCVEEDSFSRKEGTRRALERFDEGKTIFVPARKYQNDRSIPITLKDMFWNSL